jgi:hypothetical protein
VTDTLIAAITPTLPAIDIYRRKYAATYVLPPWLIFSLRRVSPPAIIIDIDIAPPILPLFMLPLAAALPRCHASLRLLLLIAAFPCALMPRLIAFSAIMPPPRRRRRRRAGGAMLRQCAMITRHTFFFLLLLPPGATPFRRHFRRRH